MAVVLGATGGIGAEVSRALAATHTVAVGCRPDATDRAADLVDDIAGVGGYAVPAPGDATTAAGIAATFDAGAAAGTVTSVVHCVGGWNFTRLIDVDETDLDAAYALNLRTAVLTLAETGRRIADGGRVVMVSSAAAALAPARQVAYAAMKAGVEAAARAASRELARRQIAVNVVRPGAVDTATLRRTTAERAIEAMSTMSAFRRLGLPTDIAPVVAFLCNPDSGWMTGSVVDLTNGLT